MVMIDKFYTGSDGEISYEELIDGLRTGNEEEIKKGFSATAKG